MSTATLFSVIGISPRGRRIVFWDGVSREFAESVLRVTAMATEHLLLIEPAEKAKPRRRITTPQSRAETRAAPESDAAPVMPVVPPIIPVGEPLYRVFAVRDRDGAKIEVGADLTLRQANHRITLMPRRGWTPLIEREGRPAIGR